jgi:hypothetical protein
MGKTSLTEFSTIGDPLTSDSFEILLSSLPAGLDSEGGRNFRIQCKTFAKPGATIEEVLQEAHGHTLRYAGRKTFTGTIPVEFVDNAEMRMTRLCEDWMNIGRTTEDQRGLPKAQYAVTATLNILNVMGAVATTYEIKGFWCKSVQDMTFDGMGQAVPANAEFAFDHYRRVTPAEITVPGVTSGA